MNIIYTLSIIVITLILNILVSYAMPFMKSKINAFITRIKRKLNTPKPVIDATTYFELSSRIDELEKKVTKRESNYRQAIRQEITSILIELKK